jgi:hypothetical protein
MKFQLFILFLLTSNFTKASTHIIHDTTIQNGIIVIEKGTLVKVTSLNEITTKKKAKFEEGDQLEFEVFEDVLVNNKIVITAGTIVKAYVESINHASYKGQEGNLAIQFSSTIAVDKTKIPLKALKSSIKGEENVGVLIGETLLLGTFAALKKGTDVKVKKGNIINAYVTRDISINF